MTHGREKIIRSMLRGIEKQIAASDDPEELFLNSMIGVRDVIESANWDETVLELLGKLQVSSECRSIVSQMVSVLQNMSKGEEFAMFDDWLHEMSAELRPEYDPDEKPLYRITAWDSNGDECCSSNQCSEIHVSTIGDDVSLQYFDGHRNICSGDIDSVLIAKLHA